MKQKVKVRPDDHHPQEMQARNSQLWMCGYVGRKTSWNNPLIPILKVFKLLGRIPYYRNGKDGDLLFEIFSLPMLWAVFSNFAQMTLVVSIYYLKLTNFEYWRDFNATIISINELIILSSSFYGFFSTWWMTPAIVRAVNRWEAYHRRFYAVTGRVVSSAFLDYAHFGLLVILIPSLDVLALQLVMGEVVSVFQIARAVVFFVCVHYIHLTAWLFVIVSCLVKRAGERFQESLIESIYKLPSPEVFYLHRTLWLELHECATELTSSFGSTFRFWNLQLFFIAVLGSYGFLVSLKFLNQNIIIILILVYVDLHAIGHVIYSCGYFAQNAVSHNIILAILSQRWTNLSERSLLELELLMDSIYMSRPCFDMDGFYVFNRSTHIVMFELFSTYMTVLVQLREQSSG